MTCISVDIVMGIQICWLWFKSWSCQIFFTNIIFLSFLSYVFEVSTEKMMDIIWNQVFRRSNWKFDIQHSFRSWVIFRSLLHNDYQRSCHKTLHVHSTCLKLCIANLSSFSTKKWHPSFFSFDFSIISIHLSLVQV